MPGRAARHRRHPGSICGSPSFTSRFPAEQVLVVRWWASVVAFVAALADDPPCPHSNRGAPSRAPMHMDRSNYCAVARQ